MKTEGQTRLSALALRNVTVEGSQFGKITELIRETVIPYQWEVLNDRVEGVVKSGCIENFKAAAGLSDAKHYGCVFQDSDFGKWLEGAAYCLETHPDPDLEAVCDDAIQLVIQAQGEDGYLNTYYTLTDPEKRFTNLRDNHELYNAGHLIEAAVAYADATGKDALRNALCRNVDCIASVLGRGEGQLRGYPGHPELELALYRLFKATGNRKYLDLAAYFLDERGRNPYYFAEEALKRGEDSGQKESPVYNRRYFQTHKPVREQTEAEGHAVRAMYLYSAMADVGFETGDEEMLETCRKLFDNIVHKRMYVTGGIGSAAPGERFTYDYDLPNDTNYAETCASVGLMMFAHRMLSIDRDGRYGDVVETALWNTVLAGMALDGKSFFYVNPLESQPESEGNTSKLHIKNKRQGWFGCACCPTNVARTVASIGQYIYAFDDTNLYIHQYISSGAAIPLGNAAVRMTTNFPYDGDVSIDIGCPEPTEFTVSLRVPGWTERAAVKLNGKSLDGVHEKGYIHIRRVWGKGDRIELSFDMNPCLLVANPNVRANIGKVAIRRGPLVYCLEQEDNGGNLHQIAIPYDAKLTAVAERELLGGTVSVRLDGFTLRDQDMPEALYSRMKDKPEYVRRELKAIPYYLWANRGSGEMQVWTRGVGI